MTTEIYNTHQQLVRAGGGVAIVLSYGGIRDRYVDGWSIYRVNAAGKHVPTDPDVPWYHHGNKWISSTSLEGTFAERQREALEIAKNWIAEQGWYSGEWRRNRARDYVPVEIDKRFPIRKAS
jgi:hypothetical protein